MATKIEVGDGCKWMTRCESCGKPVYSDRPHTRFCSDRCRKALARHEGEPKSDKKPDNPPASPGEWDPEVYRIDPPGSLWYYLLDGAWSLIGDGSECVWQKVPREARTVDHMHPDEASRRNAEPAKAARRVKPKK